MGRVAFSPLTLTLTLTHLHLHLHAARYRESQPKVSAIYHPNTSPAILRYLSSPRDSPVEVVVRAADCAPLQSEAFGDGLLTLTLTPTLTPTPTLTRTLTLTLNP